MLVAAPEVCVGTLDRDPPTQSSDCSSVCVRLAVCSVWAHAAHQIIREYGQDLPAYLLCPRIYFAPTANALAAPPPRNQAPAPGVTRPPGTDCTGAEAQRIRFRRALPCRPLVGEQDPVNKSMCWGRGRAR
eukprot:1144398-Rhodomonas_salina.1